MSSSNQRGPKVQKVEFPRLARRQTEATLAGRKRFPTAKIKLPTLPTAQSCPAKHACEGSTAKIGSYITATTRN